MPQSHEFLSDPLGFAKLHALIPDLGAADPSQLKAKPVQPKFTLYQVKGKNRVLYAKVEQRPQETNRYDIEMAEAQATSDWFPIYWLPWQENKTYRIILKPGQSLADPHVFFTAALSGCLVYIDGDPYQPTVYHSNAKFQDFDVPKEFQDGTQNWLFHQKANHMRQEVALSENKYQSPGRHYQSQSVDLFQYMPEAANTKLVNWVKKQKEVQLGADTDTVQPTMGGTVFGIRSRTHGLWTFYYQSWTKFMYQKNSQYFRQWIVNRCERFWPGGDIQKPIPIVFAND